MTSRRTISLVEPLMGLLLVLAGCGGGLPNGGVAGDGQGPPTYGLNGPPDFFLLGPDAPFKTAYRGLRKAELYYSAQAPIVYREDVGSDGLGKFSVQTTDLIVSSGADPALFMLLQGERQIQIYRHRDFRIRDYALFLTNYDYVLLPNPTTVAGVICARVQVQARLGATSRFEVDTDPVTGLVMQWEEYDLASGNLLARVGFETFTLAGDVSDMTLVDRSFQTSEYPVDSTDFSQALGFEPLVPRIQPGDGYRLDSQGELLVVQGQNWAKMYLTDGMGMCVLMHTSPMELGGAGGPGGGTGANTSTLKSEVTVMQVGSWSALRGVVNGISVIMAGRVGRMDLATVLNSALH